MKTLLVTFLTFATLAFPAIAQSNVDPASKFSWSENCGYMNWFDAGNPAGTQGARIDLVSGYAQGFIWAENIGWMNLGNGGPYTNTTGLNYGVNINPSTGAMTGMAWAENVGWINFSGGALATPPNAARVDIASGRLRGYAWGENIGWVNLDVLDSGKFVRVNIGPTCDSIDFNNDGSAFDPQDIEAFLSVFSEGPCVPGTATCGDIDFNNDGSLFDPCDIEAFLLLFNEGPCTLCGV